LIQSKQSPIEISKQAIYPIQKPNYDTAIGAQELHINTSQTLTQDLPTWKRDLDEKFRKFDQFRKTKAIVSDESSESDYNDLAAKNSPMLKAQNAF